MKMSVFDPAMDGIDHINIWSKGRTVLGRALSNFARTPFEHPKYGYFQSMEGFYYFVSTGCHRHQLKSLYGVHAKFEGRKYERVMTLNFEKIMREGLRYKVEQNPWIAKLLSECSLPFKHYYVYGTEESYTVRTPTGHDWLCDGYDYIRDCVRLKEFEMHSGLPDDTSIEVEGDGLQYIAVHRHAATEIGRLLDFKAKTPFVVERFIGFRRPGKSFGIGEWDTFHDFMEAIAPGWMDGSITELSATLEEKVFFALRLRLEQNWYLTDKLIETGTKPIYTVRPTIIDPSSENGGWYVIDQRYRWYDGYLTRLRDNLALKSK